MDDWAALLKAFKENKGGDIYLACASERFSPVTAVTRKKETLTYSDYPGLLSAMNGKRESKWAKDVSGADATPPNKGSFAKDSPSILAAALQHGAKQVSDVRTPVRYPIASTVADASERQRICFFVPLQCVGKLLKDNLKGSRELLAAYKSGNKDRGGTIAPLQLVDQEQVEIAICGANSDQYQPVRVAAIRTDGTLEALKQSAPSRLWQRWINETDSDGMTPLLRAVSREISSRFSPVFCRPEEIKFLSDNGADLLTRDSNGKNLLHHLVKAPQYWLCSRAELRADIKLRKWAFHTWLDRNLIQQLAVQECEPGKTALHMVPTLQTEHLQEILDLYDTATARTVFRVRNLYGQTILWKYSFADQLKWMLETCQTLGILKEMLGFEDAQGETFIDVINRKLINQVHRPDLWEQISFAQRGNLQHLSWSQMPANLDSYHAILNRLDFDSKKRKAGSRTQLPIEAQYKELSFVLEAELHVLDQWPPKLLETAKQLLSWLESQGKENHMTFEQTVVRSTIEDRSKDIDLAKQLLDLTVFSYGGVGKVKRTLVPWSISQRMTKSLLDEQDARFQPQKVINNCSGYY